MNNLIIYGTLIMEIIFFLLLSLQASPLLIILAWLSIIGGSISLLILDMKEALNAIKT